MKNLLTATAMLMGLTAMAQAEGELQLYNWGDYTSPELLEKFEKETGIKVTVTDYDSNDTALAKIWIAEGLLLESRPDQMENFKNMDPRWVDVAWDQGRRYSVPWQWGTVGPVVATEYYKGDINTSAIWLDPPAEVAGKINVTPEMNDVLAMATMYMGGQPCSEDAELMKKVRDKLLEAKPKWVSMDYGMTEKMSSNDVKATVYWNGAMFRSRLANPDVSFGLPKEGFPIFMDQVMLLSDAKNVEEAYKFLDFIALPENAALISAFARYGNGIAGSEEFMPADMKDAPEIVIPEELKAKGVFLKTCTGKAQDYITAIWTELQK